MKNLGFTLIEIVVSILIFALLSMGSYQILHTAIETDEIVGKKIDRLAEIQKAFNIIDRDFCQIAHRYNRYPAQNIKKYIWGAKNIFDSEDWGIEFVRDSYLNPGAMLDRNSLRRVVYRLRDNNLQRGTYLRSDPIENVLPTWENILSNVDSFELKFFADYTSSTWAGYVRETDLPKGAEVSIKLNDYGKIRREYKLNSGK